jgi:uncharacterized protein DUF3309
LFLTLPAFQSRELFPKKTVLGPMRTGYQTAGANAMLTTILLVILILMLIGALPTWGYSSGWGYGPGGIVGLLLIVVIVLALTGRI